MTAVKKAYQDVVNFLQANEDARVGDVLGQVISMTSAKSAGGTASNVMRDSEGNVTHIFCYYHKKWEPVAEVEYGAKANSSTGLNTMCKEGVSQWTKQQREAKKANEELLQKVAAGELNAADLPAQLEAIEAERQKIIPREDGIGSDEIEGGVVEERRKTKGRRKVDVEGTDEAAE